MTRTTHSNGPKALTTSSSLHNFLVTRCPIDLKRFDYVLIFNKVGLYKHYLMKFLLRLLRTWSIAKFSSYLIFYTSNFVFSFMLLNILLA